MKYGKLFGIGVGPGDPELITVKGAEVLSECKYLFVPKARIKSESLALDIVKRYIGDETSVCELVFPMTEKTDELNQRWDCAASQIIKVLIDGKDACFVTIGDPFLYSTYIYLLRSLKKQLPEVEAVTVPGIPAYCAVSAMTNFPIGEGKRPVMIIPTSDDLSVVNAALKKQGTIILMKVGKRLKKILNLLDENGVIENAVFVSRAGQKTERIETNLRKLKSEVIGSSDETLGYLSLILIDVK